MHGPIDALPAPGDALHLVVFGESCLPQAEKKASALPSLKVCVNALALPNSRGKAFHWQPVRNT